MILVVYMVCGSGVAVCVVTCWLIEQLMKLFDLVLGKQTCYFNKLSG